MPGVGQLRLQDVVAGITRVDESKCMLTAAARLRGAPPRNWSDSQLGTFWTQADVPAEQEVQSLQDKPNAWGSRTVQTLLTVDVELARSSCFGNQKKRCCL